MKLSLWGWKIEIAKEEIPPKGIFEMPLLEESRKAIETYFGEVIPGYEIFEGELANEEDSVEEREWREEQNWLNKRKQKDGTI